MYYNLGVKLELVDFIYRNLSKNILYTQHIKVPLYLFNNLLEDMNRNDKIIKELRSITNCSSYEFYIEND